LASTVYIYPSTKGWMKNLLRPPTICHPLRTNLRLLKKVTQKIPHIKINGVDCSPIKSDNSKRVEASRRASTQPTPLLPPREADHCPRFGLGAPFFPFFFSPVLFFPRPNPPLPPSRRRRLHPHFQIPASNPDGPTSPPPAHVADRRTPAPRPENARRPRLPSCAGSLVRSHALLSRAA